MAHLLALGFQVERIVAALRDFRGQAFGDGDAMLLESRDLFRVIRDEADGRNAEEAEHFGGELEVTAIGGVAQFEVRLDGVAAVILKLVGAELGHEADATALLLLIEEDAATRIGDGREGELELLATVAAQGMEDIAGEALGVNADDRRVELTIRADAVDVTHHQSDGTLGARQRHRKRGVAGFGVGDGSLEAQDAEVAPACGEIGVSNLAYVGKSGSFGHDWII